LALGDIVPGFLLEVVAEFFVQLLIGFAAMEERTQSQRQFVNPTFWPHCLFS
jgi:hypothetical protein